MVKVKLSAERGLLLLLASAQFTHIMDFMIMMPLGPSLRRAFGISPAEFGFLVSAYTFSAGIVGFFATFFLDNYDRRKAIVVIYTGFVIGTFACALSPSYEILLLCRCLTGAFGGVLGALILAIIGDAIPQERRGAAIGTVMAAFSAASVFGVPFGIYLASIFSWHSPFLFLATAGLGILIMFFIYMPKMVDHIGTEPAPKPLVIIKDFARNSNVRNALAFTVFLILGHFSIIPFISPYMVANVEFTEMELSYIYLVGGLLTFISSPLIGKLADRYGKNLIYSIFAVLALIPIFIITHLPVVPMYQALIITSVFFIVATGRMVPATTMVTSVVPPNKRGSFMSLRTATQQFSSGLASLMAGYIIVENAGGQLEHYSTVGYIAIGFSLLALFFGRKLKIAD